MDFQSAMETFAEAWVAANTGQQNQALALTRAANAAAAAAAAKPTHSPTQISDLISVKKEHSLSPPFNPLSNPQVSNTGSIDPESPLSKRRMSLQTAPDKQQQQPQQQSSQHLQQALEESRSPRYTNATLAVSTSEASSGGRRSSDTNRTLSPPHAAPTTQTRSPTRGNSIDNNASSTSQSNVSASAKLSEYSESLHNPVGTISCLPASALNAPSGCQQTHPINEKLLSSPAVAAAAAAAAAVSMEQRRDFETAKLNAKSLPLHCIVESVHSLQASLSIDTRNPWKRRPNIETDSYVIVAASTPWCEIVQTALQRLGYSQEAANTARGSLIIKNWKPIPLEQISDNPVVPVCDIIGELISVVTLRIVILRTKPSPFGEIKDKLLKLLVLQSHSVLRSTGCPLDEVLLSKICRSSYQNTFAFASGEVSEELCRKFDQWWSNQLSPQTSMTPKMLPFMSTAPSVANDMDFPVGTAAAAVAAAAAAGMHVPGTNVGAGLGVPAGSRESLLLTETAHHVGAGVTPGNAVGHHPNLMVHPAIHASMHHHHHHPHSQYPSQKTRMRTSFDPEMELPKLQKWFQENPHPSRQQIQTYVLQLNALESRRGRKPLDVNNVVYWFKNARAAQKRAEMRSGLGAMGALGHAMNGYLQQGQLSHNSGSSSGSVSQQMNVSNVSGLGLSHDYLKSPMSLKSEDIDTLSQHSDEMDDDQSRPCSPQLPLSLTTHERNRNSTADDDEEHSGDANVDTKTAMEREEDLLNGGENMQSQRELEDNKHEEKAKEGLVTESERKVNSNEPTAQHSPDNTETSNNTSPNNHSKSAMQDTETSPKLHSPKEEDEDLDMEDDDDDNDNDTSRLDDFRSPSPDVTNAMLQRKDLPFPMVPNSMFSQSFMYMSHYMPTFGQAGAAHPHAHHHAAAAAAAAGIQQNSLMGPTGLNLSNMSNEERRKRNRTFIDPVTEVPKLEQWFAMNTHPSHNLIMKYTEDLNTMPYRQKFPRLESKNVQFWFKNRRAKCKRLKMSLYDNQQCSQLSGLNSFVHKYEERE